MIRVVPGTIAAIFTGFTVWQCLVAVRVDDPKECIYAALYAAAAMWFALATVTGAAP